MTITNLSSTGAEREQMHPRTTHGSGDNLKVYRSELTPLSFLRRSAYVFPNKVAVVHADRQYTYREFEDRVDRLAARLRAAGLQKHDRVAFLSPNTPAMLEAHFAVPAAGGILVTINTRLNSREIDYILQHSGSRYLFVDAALEPCLDGIDTSRLAIVRIDDSGLPNDPYEAFLGQTGVEPLPSCLEDEEETIAINYTSGTTGCPKGVMYTYRGAYLNALADVIETGMNQDTVHLWTGPMFHCNGWCFTWAVTAAGGRHVCLRKVDADQIWDLIDREHVTHYNAAPTVHTTIVNHARAHRVDHPVTATMGGAPPSPTLLARLADLNFHIVQVYGLTETYAPITTNQLRASWRMLPSSEQMGLLARQGQGHVTADLVRVVDQHMNDIPRDGQTLGEVVMRGNIVMKGYFEQPDASAEAFRGGWFHSGDIAAWHPDGLIELRDRQKDIIISGGENISTIEIEQTIVELPAVLEVAVIAIPDEKWGERPKAFVTRRPGEAITEDEIIQHCRHRLAHFKCPAAVEFCDLPKTSTGKVQKYALREKEWAGYERRIH